MAANQTSYPDTLLDCGKSYSYRVRAYRSSDNTYSAYSNPVSATTLGCSLTKVILVDPPDTTLTTNNSRQFSWSNTGANEYQIQIDNNSNFSSPERDMVVTTNSATPSALVDGTTYSWRVRGLSSDHSQAGLWSDVWTVSIDRVRLAAPTLSLPANYANIAVLTPSFSWLAVPGATQYQLQVDDDADFSSPLFTRTPKVATYVTLATDPSLQFNKTYYWRVSAGNAANVFGNWSSVRSFTTTILKTPTNGAFSTSATPMFTWSAVTGATGYDFEVTSDPTFLTTPNDSSTGLALSHTIPTLPVNHSLAPGLYYWHVRAKIGAAVGPWMLPWTLTITPTLPVAPLLNLPLTGTQTNDTTPDLSWHPTTALVGSPFTYQVQIATTATFYGPVQDVVQSGTTYTATTLTDGVYYWRVRTINTVQVAGQTAGHASGPWSLVRSFTVDTTPPPAPTLVAPKDWSATMSTRPAFSWLAPAGAKHYTLQVFNDTNCISPLFNVPNLITTTYTIPAASTALLPGSYCWNVQAFDVLGNPPATSTNFHFTVNASAIPLPATPTLTGPANGTSATQFGTLTLTWTVSDASTKFQLQIDTTSAFSHPVVDLAPYNNTNYAASSISTPPLPAGVYYWRVRAINSQNVAGAYSAVRNFMKQYTAPPAPNLLTPAQNSSMTSQHPTLTWQAVTGAKTYVVTVADNTLWMFPVVDHKPVLAPVVSYTLTGVPETLVYGKTYYWQVQAVDAAGNTTPQGPIFHFTGMDHRPRWFGLLSSGRQLLVQATTRC